MSFRLWLFALLSCVVLVLVRPSYGQTLAEITGVVTDSTGGIVANAIVTVVDTQTGATRNARTNSVGAYTFPALQPGFYSVKVEMRGYQVEVRDQVQLQVAQTARLDFALKIGSVSQQVEVTGGAPLLNTDDTTVGTVIDNRRIVDMPLNGRNFTALIALSPNVTASFSTSGVAADRQGGERTSVAQIAVGGQRQTFNYYTLDGLVNTDVNFNTYTFLPSIDALQEFKVQTGIYSAQYGHEPSQVIISTKSGTNQYHGTVFDFLRNNYFDALPYAFTSNIPKSAPFKWNQFGFYLGGPVVIPKVFNGKDRLVFMANYEGFRLRNQTQNLYSTAPAAMRNGDFSQLLPGTVITNPAAGNTPYPHNMIPQSQLDPTAVALLNYYPLPNVLGAGLSNNYLALDNTTENRDVFLIRADYNQSDKSFWFGRYNFENDSEVSPALYQNGTTLSVGVQQVEIGNTHIFSSRWVNEARVGYTGFENNLGNELQNTTNVIQQLGIGAFNPPQGSWGIPNITLTSLSSFGTPTSGPWVLKDHTFQVVDDVSWIHGHHTIKFGAEIGRYQFNQAGNQDMRGQFTIGSNATGYNFSDYMLGYISQLQDAAALGTAQDRATTQFYYVDDSWKALPNLTVDIGLRYEYVPPWASKDGTQVNVWFPQGFPMTPPGTVPAYTGPHPCFVRVGQGDFYADTVSRFNPSICTARDGRMGSRLVKPDYKNFAPRLGVSWSPMAKTTVRAGFGIYYAQDISNTVWDMNANLAGHVASVANTSTHNLTIKNPFAAGAQSACNVPVPPYVCLSTPQGLANQYNRRTSYVEQYELNIQRELSSNMVLEAGYLGSQSNFLAGLITLNNPLVMSATAPVGPRRPAPEFGNIQELVNTLNGNYNAFAVKLTRRLSGGLTFLNGYTFSKSIDEGSGPRGDSSDVGLTPQDGVSVSYDRGLSSFNAKHRFVNSTLYDLPFGKDRKFLTHGAAGALVGGWQVGAILTYQTGFPFSVTDGGLDQSNTGETHDLPNLVPGQIINLSSGQRSLNKWFNTSAFVLQPKGTYGDSRRNTVISPGIFTIDSAAMKNFNLYERLVLQMRLEAFNTLNHPNFGQPNATVTNSAFGTISSTNPAVPMRELQISAKFIF